MDIVTERLKLKDIYPDRADELAEKLDLKAEDIEFIRKGVIAEKIEKNDEERSVISYITTKTQDRDGDIINPEGAQLRDYRKNPVVLWAHQYMAPPIAKNIWIKKTEDGLVAKTVFLNHEFADLIYRLYTEDIAGTGPAMKGWSIGFIPLKWIDHKREFPQPDEDGKTERPKDIRTEHNKWLLLEYSGVPIPSNPDALSIIKSKLPDDAQEDIEKFEKYIEIVKAKYKCECIKCGYKMTSDKHCNELKCPKCGGQMRRQERPGPGQAETDDLVTKPEETENFIRIPVRNCKVTATIDISKKQGIKALYCGKIKKIRTYIFDKRPPYNWTMKKAQAWVKEHGKEVESTIEQAVQEDADFEEIQDLLNLDDENRQFIEAVNDREVIELEDKIKGVIPFKSHPKAPEAEAWNGPRETREAEVKDLKVMCTWFDSEKPDIKSSYKLPHHKASGYTTVWRGVAAAMAALLGARGGTQIPGGDRKGCYNHLKKHYGEFDKEAPGFREYTEEELEYINAGIEGTTLRAGIFEKFEGTALEEMWRDTIKVLSSQEHEVDIKVGLSDDALEYLSKIEEEIIELKEGRVLSAKNRKLVKQCADMLNALYNATEPPEKDFSLEIEDSTDGETGKKNEKVDNQDSDVNSQGKIIEIDEETITKIIREKLLAHQRKSISPEQIEEMVNNIVDRLKGKVG